MKEYYIDFSCWTVRANSENRALTIAIKHIREHSICPLICNIEETGEYFAEKLGIAKDGDVEGLVDVESESFRTNNEEGIK